MMASASPSPKSPAEVTEKSKKYDRQLRLWGDHGQSRLEKSHICLINANATGTEILKSLVLPCVGKFTIVDGHKVAQEDIGNNFFLDADCFGLSRAECTKKLLLELNPDVNGEAIEEHPDTLLQNQDLAFFDRFSVVIGTQLSERVLISLSQTLWEKNVPFVYVHSIGFIGWIRIQFNEHTIIESHPDNVKEDLRLDTPFPELVAYMNEISLSDRENTLKMPWLVLLYKALQSFMTSNGAAQQNGNQMDTTECHPCHMGSKQKQTFKEYLQKYLRDLGLNDNDDSFEEAMKSVNTALTPTTVNGDVKLILNDPSATKPEKSKFWVMCGALKEFVRANDGQLPVRGVLPDMVAESDKYIKLQSVYRDKAGKDAEDVLGRCQELLKQEGLQSLSILDDEVRLFCKESNNIRVLRGFPVSEELKSSPTTVLQELAQNTENCDQGMMYYILLRGVLQFQSEYNAYPGLLDHDVEPDINRFKTIMNKLLNEWNASITAKEDFIHELCRYGASELPSVAAFIGGCAAQEVIKIITKQYIPLDNTLIYNAMLSTTTTFKLTPSI